MKKHLLTKLVLVAAGLFMGTSAWAVDYAIAWQNTFDEVSTYQDGWTGTKSRSQASCTVAQGTRSGDEKYISFTNNAYNTVWKYSLSGISAISSATDYVFEMDFALTRCNTSGTTGLKITNSSGAELFKVLATGADTGKGSTTLVTGSVYTNGSATAESETVTMNTFRGGTLTWYNITISSNSTDGTDLILTKCSDATETKTYHLSDNVVALGDIILDPGYGWTGVNQTYYGGGAFDNFIFYTPEDVSSVSAPTGVITDFDGTSRTIELSTLTGEATLYYSETTNDKDVDEWTEYTAAFETTSNPIYAYAKKGDYTSDVTTFATGAGAAILLNTPTAMRTGANTYTITAIETSAYGVVATQTIHYTINGGAEQTSASPANLTNVDGDIVAWTTADKFGNSTNLNVIYVAAIPTTDAAWSYNLNSYPKDHSCTAIESALDTENGANMNGTTMYNLKEESYPNLYIENATGWLLRNQASNAWKCQSARTSIAFNNVTTSDVIYIYAVNDKSTTNCVYNITNGEVRYNYSLQHFYIVPTTDGTVNVTFNTGSSINTVAVYKTTVSATIGTTGYTSFASSYPLNISEMTASEGDVEAYYVEESGVKNSYISFTASPANVAAGTGLILKGDAGATVTIPVAASGADLSATNKLVGCPTATTITNETANYEYIYVLGASVAAFQNIKNWIDTKSSLEIPAGKAYLNTTGVSTAPTLTFSFGDESTGISEMRDAQSTMLNEVYNLNGQRVAQPTKGLYITNGRKVVVK